MDRPSAGVPTSKIRRNSVIPTYADCHLLHIMAKHRWKQLPSPPELSTSRPTCQLEKSSLDTCPDGERHIITTTNVCRTPTSLQPRPSTTEDRPCAAEVPSIVLWSSSLSSKDNEPFRDVTAPAPPASSYKTPFLHPSASP